RARLTAVREGPEQALAVRRKQLAWLEAYEHSERPLVASVRISMIALRFKAGTEDRAQLIEELEAIPDEFELGDSWRTEWYWAYGELRMRYALEDLGDRESALYWARELLELYRASSDSMAANAAALARVFARELDAPDDARRAFELASTACLQRIMQAHQASEEIPELAEATPEDWATLAGYRDRLAREQGDLLDAVASHLKKGVPAFDLLARDDFICICAWCRRVRTREQTWLPVAHFLPSDPSPQVSHGICEVCRNRHFPVRPLPIA
ncbi:MAG: hypothetical protein OER88_03950, partial [Planctomycetota bacterium]|nr:hypothetical protein [Planctomycetota bacterium]